MKKSFKIVCLLLLVSFWGCSTSKSIKEPQPVDISDNFEEDEESNIIDLDSSIDKLPEELPVKSSIKKKIERKSRRSISSLPSKPEKRYFLHVRDADIEEVLLSFSKETDMNFIIDSNIEGYVTVDLKNITLKEALDALLEPLNMKYEKKGNFIRIFRPELITRIFVLNYITSTRSGSSSASFESGGGGSSSVSESTASNIWGSMNKGLRAMISDEGWSMINMDSGIIMIHDYADNIEKISEYLKIVEGSINRQVMVEIRLIQVTLFEDLNTGVNWTMMPGITGFDKLKGTLPGGALIQSNNKIGASSIQFGISTHNIDTFIQALATYGSINVISRPRVAVLNNQKSGIAVTSNDVSWQKTVTAQGGLNSFITESYTPVTSPYGIAIDVTPQIDTNGYVTMNLHPSISEVTGISVSPNGEQTSPIFDLIETHSVLRVKDGQTIIIAGFIKEKNIKTEQSIPVLGSLPIVGKLFKSSVMQKRKIELVMTVTPKILTGVRIEEATQEQIERFNKFRSKLR